MPDKEVKATVDAAGRRVTLIGEGGPADRVTFRVTNGDTLRWNLVGLPADGSTLTIRVVGFPSGHPPVPLLVRGNELRSQGTVVDGGPVNRRCHPGAYTYDVFLVNAAGQETKLECRWGGGPMDMGGGEKSGKPDG